MADLFTVTAPLKIRCPEAGSRVAVECFPHPRGVLCFLLHWEGQPSGGGITLLEGELKGQGPWKVGTCVITVLGCQGTDPELAADFMHWRQALEMGQGHYPDRAEVRRLAAQHGALVDPLAADTPC